MKALRLAFAGVAALASIGTAASIHTGFAASLVVGSGDLDVFRACSIAAAPSNTTAVADTTVQQDRATTASGTDTTLTVRSDSNKNNRIYIRFDLAACVPAIPAGVSINTAVLRMHVSTPATTCRTLNIYRVGASWSESTLTWNNQPFGTALNNPAQAQRTASIPVGGVPCANSSTGLVSGWPVTSDVRAFVAGSAPNFGWMIRDDAEGSVVVLRNIFTAKNANVAAQAPHLTITYRL